MNETLSNVLQSFGTMLALVALILIILALSMAFGPAPPKTPNAICTVANGVTMCHF